MATKGIEVHALERKIRVMAETLGEVGLISPGSRTTFAKYASIEYDALKAAWRSGRISLDMQERLALSAGFEATDPSWIDYTFDSSDRGGPDKIHPGRDTVAAFRAMLRRRHRLSGDGAFVRVVNERPQLIDSNLATFSIEDSGQGNVLGEPSPLFFSIVLERGFHPKGIEFGFRRMRLRLVFNGDSRTRVRERLGKDGSVQINGAVLEVRGSEHHPEWFLHVQEAILEGTYTTTENPLCALADLCIGETFHADISVRPMDGTLVAVDGVALTDEKKKHIIELLCSQKIPGTKDSQGWVSLGSQELRVIRADRT